MMASRTLVSLTLACCMTALSLAACSPEEGPATAKPNQATVNLIRNTVNIDSRSRILWNDKPVSDIELKDLLRKSRDLHPEPELEFQPSMDADYDVSARVLETIKDSRVTKFGFVGNALYSPSDSPVD